MFTYLKYLEDNLNNKYLKEFDKYELNLKKDELLQSMDNNYRKAVNNKFMRDYYKNKISQLKYLRDQQKKYLMDLKHLKITRHY